MSSIIKVNTYQDANGNALFSSDGSGNVTLSSNGLQNKPNFFAYLSSDQSLSGGAYTKLNVNAELWDTDSAYDTTNSKFVVPSGEGGKYIIGYSIGTNATLNDGERLIGRIYINGSGVNPTTSNDWSSGGSRDLFVNYTGVFDLSASDYVELYGFHSQGGSISILSNYTRLWGNKLIGA